MTSVGAERWIKSRGLKCYVRGDGGGKVLDTKYHPLKPKILRRRRFMKAAPGVAAVQKEERGTNTVHTILPYSSFHLSPDIVSYSFGLP